MEKAEESTAPAMAEETIAPVVTLRKNVIDLRLPKILLCLHCPIS
jgi:hypothetical protein